jgi:DNA-directed RNA polymerase subunit RPC12/RpoP
MLLHGLPEEKKDLGSSAELEEAPEKELMWEYVCHDCNAKFKKHVPRGPKEERDTRCPNCQSAEIERLNVGVFETGMCAG